LKSQENKLKIITALHRWGQKCLYIKQTNLNNLISPSL